MYNTLKTSIINSIKTNKQKSITGQILQDRLIEIVNNLDLGGLFLGFAGKNTNPNPQANGFYFSTEPGEYSNFIGRDGLAITIGDGLEIIYRFEVDNNWIWDHNTISSNISQEELNNKVTKVNGTTDNFVAFGVDGEIKDSNKNSSSFATIAQGNTADTIASNYLKAGSNNKILDKNGTEINPATITSNVYNPDDTTLENRLQNIENNKVDKISGRQLSQENFTTEEKTKLDVLSYIFNYNPDLDTISIKSQNGTVVKEYKLTEYIPPVPAPDFYAFFADIKYSSGNWQLYVNNEWKIFSTATSEDFMSIANEQGVESGFNIKTTEEKLDLVLHDSTIVKCDYVHNLLTTSETPKYKGFIILSKTTSTLDFVILDNELQTDYIYQTEGEINKFNPNMVIPNGVLIDDTLYNLNVYRDSNSADLNGNIFGINYSN